MPLPLRLTPDVTGNLGIPLSLTLSDEGRGDRRRAERIRIGRVSLFLPAGDEPEFVMEQFFHEPVPSRFGMHYVVKVEVRDFHFIQFDPHCMCYHTQYSDIFLIVGVPCDAVTVSETR